MTQRVKRTKLSWHTTVSTLRMPMRISKALSTNVGRIYIRRVVSGYKRVQGQQNYGTFLRVRDANTYEWVDAR